MRINQNNTYFIVGHHGVGKTFLCNLLEEYCGDILHLDCGPTVRFLHQQSGSLLSFRAWTQEAVERYGDDFLSHGVLEEFKKQIALDEKSNTLVITGNRNPRHIEYLSKGLGVEKPSIIFVDSFFDLQKSNYENREGKILTNEEFQMLINHDVEMGIEKLKAYVQSNPEHCAMLFNFDNDSDRLLRQLLAILARPISE